MLEVKKSLGEYESFFRGQKRLWRSDYKDHLSKVKQKNKRSPFLNNICKE